MKPRHITKTCKSHGDVKFVLEGRGYYRCTKCRSEAVQRRRDKIKRMAIEHMGGQCHDCGQSFPDHPSVYDFHHLDPNQKDFGIARYGHTRSWERVKAELDKCVMLCANCHRIRHDGM